MSFDTSKTLRVRWSKKENDLLIEYPDRPDGWLVHYHISKEKGDFKQLLKELHERGYDITTFRMSIHKKKRESESDE